MSHNYMRRILRAVLGILIFACGSTCNIQANVGLGPWEAFSVGVGSKLGLSFGTVLAGTGILILVFDLFLKEKIGLGTLFDIFGVGPITDILRSLGVIPMMQSFLPGIFTLLMGQLCIAVGSYFYIGAGLSCGPRDLFMVSMCRRFPQVPVGVIRFFIEGSALLVGWLCGGKVGVGTIVACFGISFLLQAVFMIMKFDVNSVRHESIIETTANVFKR